MSTNQLGVIGLGTMGANLARNAARNGAEVTVFNRTTEKVQRFLSEYGKEGSFHGVDTLSELCSVLRLPRSILLMVKAGEAVDELIRELLPRLSKGDILIDAGNSFYRDTERREKELQSYGIHFLGLGVSGGVEGALLGPSMMPGGSKAAYASLESLLKKMAADDSDGGKCIAYLGPGGAGHFVKMVHNGIEYGMMQLIAESYHLLKVEGGLSNTELAKTFTSWDKDEDLQGFLVECTAKIFQKKDPETGKDLIDMIADQAGQKGTGRWTTEAAFHYGVSVPTITAGLDARLVSSVKEFRVMRSREAPDDLVDAAIAKKDLAPSVRDALELSIMNTFAQGMQLLSIASEAEAWHLPVSEIARIWRGGCIIRSTQLQFWQKAFSGDKKASAHLRERCSGERLRTWRRVVAEGALRGIPLPAMSSALSYYDGYRSAWLPQNLTQAQRDFFGAHGYERLDRPGTFHSDWT